MIYPFIAAVAVVSVALFAFWLGLRSGQIDGRIEMYHSLPRISADEVDALKAKAQWAEKAASVLLSNNTPVKASFAPLHELAATWNQITGEKP